MCFSATASFALFGTLVPAGAYAMARTAKVDAKWLPFAAFPLAFGVQQGVEGLVWLGVESGNTALVAIASRGFLFFSHFFWLAWVPFAAWMIERGGMRRNLQAVLAWIGLLFGLSIFLPSFLFGDWLRVELVQGSLEYRTTLIYEDYVSRTVLRLVYAAIVVSALLVSTDRRIQVFGLLITASLILTYAAYAYAFISVWCFFAALLSLYLVAVVIADTPREMSRAA